MVEIANRIWSRWAAIEPFGDPSIDLLFASPLGDEEAVAAVSKAASETMRELAARPPHPTGEEFSTGAWALTAVPGGVALRIDEEPEDFEAVVGGIAARLERAGVAGSLDLLDAEAAARLPELVDFLECRLRVDGRRRQFRPGGNWGWFPDETALAAAVETALAWCTASEPAAPLTLAVGLLAPVRIANAADAVSYVRHATQSVAELGVWRLAATSPEGFRVAAVEPSRGRVSLLEGGRDWRTSLGELKEAAAASAGWAIYAFIKRGSRRLDAELGQLYMDWVPITRYDSLTGRADAFQDEYAPDVFGVQLLGAGYAGRVPKSPDWIETEIGESAVLLEHHDAAAWFDGSLVPFGGYPLQALLAGAVPMPEAVAEAREVFADILYSD